MHAHVKGHVCRKRPDTSSGVSTARSNDIHCWKQMMTQTKQHSCSCQSILVDLIPRYYIKKTSIEFIFLEAVKEMYIFVCGGQKSVKSCFVFLKKMVSNHHSTSNAHTIKSATFQNTALWCFLHSPSGSVVSRFWPGCVKSGSSVWTQRRCEYTLSVSSRSHLARRIIWWQIRAE